MSDDTTDTGPDDYRGSEDQDSEPTMMAPEEGRPDGLDALKGESQDRSDQAASPDAGSAAQQPDRSGSEVMESQEEDRPADADE